MGTRSGLLVLGLLISAGAFAQDADLEVFSESASFETMVKERRAFERNPASMGPSVRVIAVRRELGLTRREADQAPHDVVLNGGSASGLSEGMRLKVKRKVPILDPYDGNRQKELEISFAEIEVLHVQENLAVARIQNIEPILSGIGVGLRGVLIGDHASSR